MEPFGLLFREGPFMPETWTPDFFRTVLDELETGVYVIDREGKIHLWNRGAERITGHARHDVVGHWCRSDILSHCNNQSCQTCKDACPIGVALHEGRTKEAHLYLLHKAGQRVPIHVWNVPIRDEHGSVIAVAGSFEAIPGGRRTGLTRLAECGCLDELTGVGNHRFTEFHLREHLASFLEYQIPFGVVVVQVNQLDRWRTTYGHEAVSAALGVVAETIRNCIRPTDFLGRWTDHRFVVIAENCTQAGLDRIIARFQKAVAHAELQWWGDWLQVAVSIGQAAVEAGDTVEMLLERAQNKLPHTPDAANSEGTKA